MVETIDNTAQYEIEMTKLDVNLAEFSGLPIYKVAIMRRSHPADYRDLRDEYTEAVNHARAVEVGNTSILDDFKGMGRLEALWLIVKGVLIVAAAWGVLVLLIGLAR